MDVVNSCPKDSKKVTLKCYEKEKSIEVQMLLVLLGLHP